MLRAVLLTAALGMIGCQCGTGALERSYACDTDGECAEGFSCNLASRTCVSNDAGTGGGGGGAIGGGNGGGSTTGGGGGGSTTGGGGGGSVTGGGGGGSTTGGGGGSVTGGGGGGSVTGGGGGGSTTGGGGGSTTGGGGGSMTTGGGGGSSTTGGGGGSNCTRTGPESCADGVDNDCNGLTDCLDLSPCANQRCGGPGFACRSGACTCLGAVVVASPDAGPGEISTISSVQNASAQKVAWAIPGRGTLTYAECTSGCTTLSPLFTSAVILATQVEVATIQARPQPLGGVAAAVIIRGVAGANFTLLYGECTANCLMPTSWTWAGVDNDVEETPPQLTLVPGLTAIAYGANNDSAYAECLGICSAAGAWQVGKPFSQALTARPGLGAAMPARAYLSSTGELARCTNATCTAGNWNTLAFNIGSAEGGVVHFDDAGFPRAFGQSLGSIRDARCTTPCSAPSSFLVQVVTTGVAPGSQLDVAFDAQQRAAIVFQGQGSALSSARETDAGWAVGPVPGCGTPLVGALPVAELTSSGQLRAFFHATNTRDIRYYVAP